jgi:hypothetical protein
MKSLTSLIILAGILLSTTGCVCLDGACGPMGNWANGRTCGGCGGCDGDCHDMYSGPGPLGSIVRHCSGCECSGGGAFASAGCGGAGCGGAGCGEMYFDEWFSEPPMVDDCGCSQESCCGRHPIRSFLSRLLGRQCSGDCDGGACELGGPIIHDGYDASAWSNNRGCSCGACSTSAGETVSSHSHGDTNYPTAPVSPVAPNQTQMVPPAHESAPAVSPQSISPPVSSAPSMGPLQGPTPGVSAPTPAPPMPKSAARLNPTNRRMVR